MSTLVWVLLAGGLVTAAALVFSYALMATASRFDDCLARARRKQSATREAGATPKEGRRRRRAGWPKPAP